MTHLDEILKRCEAATPGLKLEFEGSAENGRPAILHNSNGTTVVGVDCGKDYQDPLPEAQFIAHAREDLPLVVADRSALRRNYKQVCLRIFKQEDKMKEHDGKQISFVRGPLSREASKADVLMLEKFVAENGKMPSRRWRKYFERWSKKNSREGK